jgi:peptide/nickel transport system ATP-binding protein
MTLVSIENLTIESEHGTMVAPLSATIDSGRTLALIGESGSGKTLTAKSLVGLLPRGLTATGRVLVADAALPIGGSEEQWRAHRGGTVALVLQDPFTSLSPVHAVGAQIAWTVEAARGARLGRAERVRAVAAALDEVRLPSRVAAAYPHQLSGGMRQRIAIAAALAANPSLLIADEPTTALDASNQAEILDLLRSVQAARGLAIILISHDLGLVRGRTDDVLVMSKGEVVERGTTVGVLTDPRHEYTRALLDADPVVAAQRGLQLTGLAGPAGPAAPQTGRPLLVARGIAKSFAHHRVLDDVSVTVTEGQIVGIVGESGSGKSTLARCLAGLEREDEGSIAFEGVVVAPGRASRTPGQMQMVFQDPYSSLNPAMSVGAILREALGVAGRPASDVGPLLETVGLRPDFAAKRPFELSGGQRQRVAIARALAPRPRVLICDESVSALDVSVQAQILNLITGLRRSLGLGIVFISHDLAVVRLIADTVVVMKEGRVVEEGTSDEVLNHPSHPYTRLLLAASRRENSQAVVSTAEEITA